MIQAKMSMNLGFLAFETEIIDTGEKMYLKDPTTGEWTVDESSGSLVANPAEFIDLDTEDLESVTLARNETIAGVDHYVIEAKANDVEGAEVAYTFWVRVPDNLIARIEAVGKITPPEGQLTQGLGDIGNMKLAMSLSDYGKDIEIVAPVQPSLQPATQSVSQAAPKAGKPLTDDSVLAAYAAAMTSAGSARVVGEVNIKNSPDAETSVMRQTFEGEGVLGGDNRTAGTIDINDSGFSATIPFESRRVDGVEYELDPQTNQWVENPQASPASSPPSSTSRSSDPRTSWSPQWPTTHWTASQSCWSRGASRPTSQSTRYTSGSARRTTCCAGQGSNPSSREAISTSRPT